MTDCTDPTPPTTALGSNQSGVRAHNERLVLTLIRQAGALAKAEIARRTGLSPQTVSNIIGALEEDGLLLRGTPQRGRVGQPSVPMRLAPDGAFFLGLKVGRRSLDLVLTDFHGQLRGRLHQTHRYPSPDGVVRFATDGIAHLIGSLPPELRNRVAGLGIALPFRLWDWAGPLGVDPDRMEDWRHRDVAAEIAAPWPFPVFLRNDASAACGAELVFGTTDKPRDFLYFYIGYFAGGGLVLDNTLFTGRTGNAAALGSMPVGRADGRILQLVDVASLRQLELLAQGIARTEAIWRQAGHWTLPQSLLDDWVEAASEGLAMAILSAACLIDFDCAMIDGWLPATLRKTLVERTAARMANMPMAGMDPPSVRAGSIGPEARALGAASLPLSERFLVDRSGFPKG